MNYNRIYNQLVDKRKADPYLCGYSENHHIIPRCAGGTDDKDNLVRLSAREHYIAHLLLTKIYKNTEFHSKLIFAWHMMANMKVSVNYDRNYRINSYLYARLKEEHAKAIGEANSIHQLRLGNSQYGTRWIHNLELRESQKISNDCEIPVGWAVGRVISWDFLDRKCSSCDKHLGLKKRSHIKECKECSTTKKDANHNKKFQENSIKYLKMWCEFIEGDFRSIHEYSKTTSISSVTITKNWEIYVDGFRVLRKEILINTNMLSSIIAREYFSGISVEVARLASTQ